MPNLTNEQYQVLLDRERAREAKRKLAAGGVACPAISESPVQHRPDGALPRKVQDSARYAVRITARRTILLDPDNLVGGAKYFIDSLRIAGLIPDDTPEKIALTVTQEKVQGKHQQCTIVEVERIA